MNKSIDLARMRTALKGKELVGFDVSGELTESATARRIAEPASPEGGRPRTRAVRIGVKKSGATKLGQSKSGQVKPDAIKMVQAKVGAVK